jgi:hypothetical protein
MLGFIVPIKSRAATWDWVRFSNIVRGDYVEREIRESRAWRRDHGSVATENRKMGFRLRPLPFVGAIHCVSHEENFGDFA